VTVAELPVRDGRRVGRREFLKQAGAVGLVAGVPTGLLTACGSSGSSSSSSETLAIGTTDWLPPDFYIKNSLSAALLTWVQFAWPLYVSSGSGYEYRNGLAAGYDVSADGLTHTVTLRKGITFHSGKPIDAKAVAANLTATFFVDDPLHEGEASYPQAAITIGEPPIVKSVDPVGADKVKISLSEFRSDIKVALAFVPILDPETLATKGYGTNAKLLNEGGSGPFELTKFEPGDFAELVAYPKFFEQVKPQRLRVVRFADPGALALALKSGEVAVASGLAKADFDNAVGNGYKAVTSEPAVNVDLLLSHYKDPAFDDVRVRKALALAMNRKAYSERFFSVGTARESSQPVIPPGLPGYVKELQPLPYDPEAARKLLAEAGQPAPKLKLEVPSARAPISSTKGLAEAIAADAGQAGFEIEIEVLDDTIAAEKLENEELEAFVEGPGGQPDPFILFDLFFGYPEYQPGPLGEYPEITEDLAAAHATHDIAKRNELLEDIIRTTTEEVLMIPIAVVDYSAVASEDVGGFPLSCTQLDPWNRVTVGG
jgi:ABC-type transport system substrate-binding protein